ncbi:chromosomal protein D1 [Silurus asotus]|uniref:Chromosomal protein D1 n=1 Tax=Silurus asotus TaxID=30991 RepID=A0AAD5AT32_SILAS|nr:chromosomal protein D1 [Silurus asotus]
MEVEEKDASNTTMANGRASSGKRGRGRPRGSVKKKMISMKETSHHARTSKQVDFFSPEMIRPKAKKRGRPKKIRIPGRPRKIPLSPEEEAERILRLSNKRKLSKPLGRPRIHPLGHMAKEKRGRGRPRKYGPMASQNGRADRNLKTLKISEVGGDTPRGRGRPRGSFKKKRGRPSGPSPAKRPIPGTPGRRGRPPGSGTKLHVKQVENGTPRRRGRPPGSRNKLKVISVEANGTPRKRGRPPGSGTKVRVEKRLTNSIPRKRGRPPGSGTKIKGLLRETNGSPRKRGRPPGSGKVKTVTEEAEHVLNNSALSVNAQPRKRGRPKKPEFSSVVQGEEAKSKENDEPSPKRPRNSYSSSKNSSKPGAEDQKASENDACHAVENTVLSAGGAAKPDRIAQVGEELNHAEVHESNSRKNLSSRVAGKSQKKK